MAVRVRKLAKQVQRTPHQVLGLLHALGFVRYRSADDMLSDRVVAKLRQGLRDGVQPVPLPANVTKAKPVPATPSAPPTPPAPTKPTPTLVEPPPKTPSPAALLAEQRQELEALAAELASQRHELEQARAALEAGQQAPRLEDLLEARGLKGRDEQVRAIRALMTARHFHDLLPRLFVADVFAVEQLLAHSLVLVSGSPPEGLPPGLGAVEVAPDRAEFPSAAQLLQRVERLGEHLLLNGITRVVVLGGPPLGQRLLASAPLDARIQFVFLPPTRKVDAARADLQVGWGVAPRAVDGLRSIHVEQPTLDAFFAALQSALA